MFLNIVFVCLMGLLVLGSGAAIYMGIFKGHRKNVSAGRKVLGRGVSYGVSLVFWCACYSWYYLGW